MLDFEKWLKKLECYNIAFEIKDNYYYIKLAFSDEWDILQPEDEYIHVEKSGGLVHYIADMRVVSLNALFETINKTVEHNMLLAKKLLLFKMKVKELEKLFSEEDFVKLEKIQFTFGNKKGRKKKEGEKLIAKKKDVKIEEENNKEEKS